MKASTASVSPEDGGKHSEDLVRWGRLAAFLLSVTVAIAAAAVWGHLFEVSDAEHYLRLAHGDSSVMQPFASRQLGPLLARALAALLDVTFEHAFVLQGVISLLLLAAFVFLGAPRSLPPWLLAAMAVVPFWPQLFHDLALPDLVYAALLAVLLLLLRRGQWLASAAMMFPLMLTRESTSLTLLCLLIAAWRELRWPGKITSVVAATAGALLVARLSAHSVGNTEHLPGMLYLLLKAPWNAIRLLGLQPWSSRYQYLCAEPRWQVPVPIHAIGAIGVCGFHYETPLLALGGMTTTFGLLPLLLLSVWRYSREPGPRASSERPTPELRFALIYGVASFVLAPVLGTGYSRLFGYAWPLVLVALPLLAAQSGWPTAFRSRHAALLALHLVACAAGFAGAVAGAILGAAAWAAASVVLFRADTSVCRSASALAAE